MAGGRKPVASSSTSRWRVEVLGPCRLVDLAGTFPGDVELTLLQRTLLARLAVDAPRAVTTDALLTAAYGDEPPATARASLQNQVSRIRRAAEPGVIVTHTDGYALGPDVVTDVAELVGLLEVAGRAVEIPDPSAAVEADRLQERISGLLRGDPMPELADAVAVAGARSWLEGLIAAAGALRLEAALRAGRAPWAAAEAERHVAAAPLDEGRWLLLVRALDASGRRGDALAAVQRARRTLRDELGVDPGPELRAAEQRLLDGEAPPAGSRPPVPTVAVVLRGRDRELEHLTELVAAGASAVVVGEDGAGRSLLLGSLVTWLRRARRHVIPTVCTANPAAPVAVLAELAGELSAAVEPRLGPVDGFLTALAAHAARRPVALVVDDLHLAGPTTREALSRAVGVPGVVVVASRAEDGHEVLPGAVEVHLGPLDGDALAELARDLLGPGTEVDVEELSVRSGGNPFLARCIVEDGMAGATGAAESVTSVVRRRLGRLGEAALAAIRVAAVVGDGCRDALVHRLASERGLAAAQEAGVLVRAEDGTIGFRHRVVAEVVHRDLPAGERAELHHAVARLERDAGSSSAVVARHLLEAVDLDVRTAHATAMAAAREAGAAGAHRDAARWYELAAGAAAGLGADAAREVLRADIGRGDELRLAGDPGHVTLQLAVMERALADGDPRLIGDAAYALLQLGGTSEAGAANADAVAAAERALVLLEGDERWAVVAGAASLTCSLTGLADRSRELYLAAEARAVSPEVRRLVLPFTYLGLGHADDLPRRAALTAELLDLAAAADDPVAVFEGHHLAFSVALQRADGPGVRAALAGMDRLVDAVGDVGRRWQLLYCAAAVAHLDDDLERAEQVAGASYAVFATVQAARAFAAYGSQLILLRLAQGRVAELAPAFEGLVATQPEVGAWHGLLALCIAESDPVRAAHHAGVGLGAVPGDFTWLAAHTLGARGAARAARAGAADAPLAAYRDLLAPYADRIAWQGTCAYGPVAIALAELAAADGDPEAARGHLATAARLADALGAPVFRREAEELRAGLG